MSVFISYLPKDIGRVREIVDILHDGGFETTFEARLSPERPWTSQLEALIQPCSIFVYVLSASSAQAAWCQWEFALAARLGKPIIPVLLEMDIDAPLGLDGMPAIDFTSGPTGAALEQLALMLRAPRAIPEDNIPPLPNTPAGEPTLADPPLTLTVTTRSPTERILIVLGIIGVMVGLVALLIFLIGRL